MNPETGVFHTGEELEAFFGPDEPMKKAEKAGWPLFTLGEEIEVKGQPFKLQQITKDNRLVLVPKRLTTAKENQ